MPQTYEYLFAELEEEGELEEEESEKEVPKEKNGEPVKIDELPKSK